MQNFAKTFAKRAAVPITAAAVGSTSAQARVSPNVREPAASVPVPKLEDEWLIPQVNGANVFFKPYSEQEINECCAELTTLFCPPPSAPAVIITEVSPDGSVCSEGSLANDVIEAADDTRRRGCTQSQREQFSSLVQLASKMLRRPGVQSELFASMMEDPEVRDLMLTQCDDLDSYLLAAGVGTSAHHLLLPGALTSDAVIVEGEDATHDINGDDQSTLVASVVGAVSSLLQRAGGAFAALGGWLQGRLSFLLPSPTPPPDDGAKAQPSESEAGRKKLGVVMSCVMVLMVAMLCMLLVRHPTRARFRRS